MSGSAEILAAFRELSNAKQIDRAELHALLQDGIHAALAKKHGPNVQADVSIDESKGEIRIVLLKTVVEAVEDPSREIALEEARFEDPEFQVGDVMEEPVEFAEFGRSAVQAARPAARRPPPASVAPRRKPRRDREEPSGIEGSRSSCGTLSMAGIVSRRRSPGQGDIRPAGVGQTHPIGRRSERRQEAEAGRDCRLGPGRRVSGAVDG